MCAASLMRGFPPSPETQVTLANWRTAPFNKWAFQHVRELIPSADIVNDPDDPWSFSTEEADFGGLLIKPRNGPALTYEAFLKDTDTDGMVVIHKGKVVCERYANGMARSTPHIWMSVSKSILGVIAGILADRGVLDPERPVSDFVPEIGATAYATARIRHLLDMRVGVHFDENYLATSGPIVEYRKAQNWNPLEPGDRPSDLRSFYRCLQAADGPHGARFHYVSPNTDLLGWIIERATGQRYADLVSRLLWQPLGASDSAYITVDRLGAPRCAGGFNATVADLARLGQLIVQGGRRGHTQVIADTWIQDVLTAGDHNAWKAGDFIDLFPSADMHYRNQWYVQKGPAPMMFGFGVHGQHLFVDACNELVIARAASQAAAIEDSQIALTMLGVSAIRDYLRRG
jgi:CubicO group peptidase (beta-lactamase class C family)